MITKLGEVSGGVSGGKRGLLRLNSNVSLPLRKFLRQKNLRIHNERNAATSRVASEVFRKLERA